jgi:hypothetical protein
VPQGALDRYLILYLLIALLSPLHMLVQLVFLLSLYISTKARQQPVCRCFSSQRLNCHPPENCGGMLNMIAKATHQPV